jgi:hypothetical protein
MEIPHVPPIVKSLLNYRHKYMLQIEQLYFRGRVEELKSVQFKESFPKVNSDMLFHPSPNIFYSTVLYGSPLGNKYTRQFDRCVSQFDTYTCWK